MFLKLNRSQSRTTRDGEQRAGGPFLFVVMAPGVPFREARAFVRPVRMRQCGHFMMGQIEIGGFVASVSGTYGANGLPADVPRDVYDAAIPIPAEILEIYATGGGHNGAGAEGPLLRAWAAENEPALRKAGKDLPTNGRARVAWLIAAHEIRALEYRATTPIPEEIYRDPNAASAAIRARGEEFTDLVHRTARELGLSDREIARHPWAAMDRAHVVLSERFPE